MCEESESHRAFASCRRVAKGMRTDETESGTKIARNSTTVMRHATKTPDPIDLLTMRILEDMAGADPGTDSLDPPPPTEQHEDAKESNDGEFPQELQKFTPEELVKVASKLLVVDMSSEDMDPIEWTVRKVLPIPCDYYWDVIPEEQHAEIPTSTKVWHRTISFLCRAHEWTNQHVAQPLVSGLGLTESRFDYVVDQMTPEQWERSKARMAERISEHEPPTSVSERNEEQTETSTSSP